MRLRSVLVLVASLALVGCTNMNMDKSEGKKGEENEGNEVKMKFSEIPAAVQKTFTDAANGAKIAPRSSAPKTRWRRRWLRSKRPRDGRSSECGERVTTPAGGLC